MSLVNPDIIYLDANAIIQLVEGEAPELLFLAEMAAADLIRIYTSELSLAEVLVGPLRKSQNELVNFYEDMLKSDDFIAVLKVDRPILRHSAELRATLGFKGPDAIHVATSLASGCTIFVSSDKRIRLPEGMKRVELHQLNEAEE